ncbi:hypothetical protein [Acinetobacter phage vB_AbaM_CP14]|nr:hypothetical protein [Acinetobacter phage vB_AbaM_CP14]
MDKIDYASLAKSRYTSQFEQDKVYDAIIQTIIEYKLKTQDLYINFAETILDIEKSTGKNLDLIGSIVGQPRILVDFSIDKYFGFLGNPRAEPYDVGLWYSTFSTKGSDSRVLTDEEYRRIIKARIIRNNTNCNREDFIKILDLILGIDSSITYSNILPNSDFKVFSTNNCTVEHIEDKDVSDHSITKITSTLTGTAPDVFLIDTNVKKLRLISGKQYTLSVKASSSTGTLVSSAVWNGLDKAQNIFSNLPVSEDRKSPTKINVSFVASDDLIDGSLVVGSEKGLAGDWIEISELMVREGDLPYPDEWTPAKEDSAYYSLDVKSHGNINLDVYNYKGDLGVHFLSNYEKTGDLIPKPLGYKLSVMIH